MERYAKMRTLTDARVLANNTTKYHTIYNANIDIQGRKRFSGTGDYDYIDENKVKHHFHFDEIGVDTTFQTVARGQLADTAGFPLSPQFLFKGDVRLTASKEYLNFSGFTKPNIQCEKIGRNWIRFSGDINPANVSIPIASPVTDDGAKLIRGCGSDVRQHRHLRRLPHAQAAVQRPGDHQCFRCAVFR